MLSLDVVEQRHAFFLSNLCTQTITHLMNVRHFSVFLYHFAKYASSYFLQSISFQFYAMRILFLKTCRFPLQVMPCGHYMQFPMYTKGAIGTRVCVCRVGESYTTHTSPERLRCRNITYFIFHGIIDPVKLVNPCRPASRIRGFLLLIFQQTQNEYL